MLMSPCQERVERLCFKIIPLPLTDLGNRAAKDLLNYNVFRRVMNAAFYSAQGAVIQVDAEVSVKHPHLYTRIFCYSRFNKELGVRACVCRGTWPEWKHLHAAGTYRYKKAEGYPRLSFHPSYTSEWRPHAECIQAHICTWCCSQRNGLGRWPWSQTEARRGPRNETTQNLEREK